MKTELQDIADKLQGYSDDDYYEIAKAERNAKGVWVLEVRHVKKLAAADTEGAKNESDK